MAVFKAIFVGLSLLVFVVGIVVGFLIGYFTHPRERGRLLAGVAGSDISQESRGTQWEFDTAKAALANATGGGQDWGYVDVRSDAHMFWWLFETTHPDGVDNRPLILWIQGGPGLSGVGYGNFQLIGPLNLDMEPRETSWVTEASLLLVDNPVGAGYSYVDNEDAFAKDIDTITSDLLAMLTHFMERHPVFKTAPLFIMGQSYGGKMTAAFSKTVYQATEAGHLEANLRGFAMGNAWISPADSIRAWGPMLLEMSLIDVREYVDIESKAESCVRAMSEERWTDSSYCFNFLMETIYQMACYVSPYNILVFEHGERRRRAALTPSDLGTIYLGLESPLLQPLMDGPVREYLQVIPDNVSWGGQQNGVYFYHLEELNKPVIDRVDWMLENTDVQAVVYQGQLDLICNVRGALSWVERLEWSGLDAYHMTPKETLANPETGEAEMFLKANDNFKFFWIFGAGHAVPEDRGGAGLRMLRQIINDTSRQHD